MATAMTRIHIGTDPGEAADPAEQVTREDNCILIASPIADGEVEIMIHPSLFPAIVAVINSLESVFDRPTASSSG